MKFQPPRGTRDFLPNEMIKRQYVYEMIRKVFDSYGYGEVWTPAFEDFELLSKKSGPDIENEIYVFEDKSGRKLGLRFDPTVPICRIISQNPTMPKPVKFCYITNMWRYDRPGTGRFREFWQAGVELIGSDKPEADAEILAVVSDILKAMGVENFYFKINSRKIMEKLIKKSGIPDEKKQNVFRIIDKLAKIGEDGVKKEMEQCGIEKEKIRSFVNLVNSGNEKAEELEEIKDICKNIGIKNIEIDFSIVRGIDYYTGFVFETFLKGKENIGSIASGGRYDSLIGIYSGNNIPATGFGLGIDRLLDAVEIKTQKNKTKILVAFVDDAKNEALKLSYEMRNLGINAEFDLLCRPLKKQFDYANAKGIPFVAIVGPKELKEGKLKLRDMKTGEETSINMKNLKEIISVM